MKKIEKILPYAFEALKLKGGLVQIDPDNNNEEFISSQYNGYISAFGASIQQSGLVAALVFNHRKKTDSEQDPKKLMDAIYYVVKKMRGLETENASLLEFTQNNLPDKRRIKKQILDAATALKLVIRTYKLKKQ